MIKVTTTGNGVDLEKIITHQIENMPNLIRTLTETTRQEQEDQVRAPRSYDGSALKPLSAKYLALKRRNYPSTDIFKGKHLELINSMKSSVTDRLGIVYIASVRDNIMTYLENGGRRGFGLGRKLEEKLNKITEKYIKVG